jgi:hypothetical protein
MITQKDINRLQLAVEKTFKGRIQCFDVEHNHWLRYDVIDLVVMCHSGRGEPWVMFALRCVSLANHFEPFQEYAMQLLEEKFGIITDTEYMKPSELRHRMDIYNGMNNKFRGDMFLIPVRHQNPDAPLFPPVERRQIHGRPVHR